MIITNKPDPESDPETDYFYHRAEAELTLAQRATNPEAVRAHYVLAGHYLDRVYGPPAPSEDADEAPAS